MTSYSTSRNSPRFTAEDAGEFYLTSPLANRCVRAGLDQLGTIHILLHEIELLQNQCAKLLAEKPPVLFDSYSDSANFK
jgi:hypothetical protein